MRLADLLKGIKAFIMGGELPTPEECRQTPRLFCQYRVNLLAAQGTEFKATVVDIGATGLGLECHERVASGTKIRLSFPLSRSFVPENAVEADVVWCRVREHDHKVLIGARYTETPAELERSWVWTLLEELGIHKSFALQKRKHRRMTTSLKAELRELDSGRFLTQGNVSNLSVGGALIASSSLIKEDTRVLLLIGPHLNYPTLSIHAKLVATREEEGGDCKLLSLQFIDVTKPQMKSLESTMLKMLAGRE